MYNAYIRNKLSCVGNKFFICSLTCEPICFNVETERKTFTRERGGRILKKKHEEGAY